MNMMYTNFKVIRLWILQCLCVRQEDGAGGAGGASDIKKAKSSEEDPRATAISNLPHIWVNKTKQHTLLSAILYRHGAGGEGPAV